MAIPAYGINPTNTHIYSNASSHTSDTGVLTIPANGIFIPAASSVTLTLQGDDTDHTITTTNDIFLPLRVVQAVPAGGAQITLFW
jgi:hypothetical protein